MRVTDWNAFDWLIVTVTAFSMLMAFRRGLLRAMLGLLGFVAGFQMASWYYVTVGDWVISGTRLTKSQPIAHVLAFLLLVVAVAAAFELVGRLLQKTLVAVGLGGFDRALGVAFGFARGCLISIALLMAWSTCQPQSETLTSSVLSPYLFDVVLRVSFLVPQYFQGVMADGAFDFKKNPPHWINRP